VVRYRDDPNRVQEFTKHPATWLNGDCWLDDPLPPRERAGKSEPTAERYARHMRLIEQTSRGNVR
jgi:hypothetical protein